MTFDMNYPMDLALEKYRERLKEIINTQKESSKYFNYRIQKRKLKSYDYT